MSRFHVSIPVDYVMGFLRYGHYEGYFEAENVDQVMDMIKSPEGKDNLDFYVDDYRVEDIGDLLLEYAQIEKMDE